MTQFTNAQIKPGPLLSKFHSEQKAFSRISHDKHTQQQSHACHFPECTCDLQNNGRHLCPKETKK